MIQFMGDPNESSSSGWYTMRVCVCVCAEDLQSDLGWYRNTSYTESIFAYIFFFFDCNGNGVIPESIGEDYCGVRVYVCNAIMHEHRIIQQLRTNILAIVCMWTVPSYICTIPKMEQFWLFSSTLGDSEWKCSSCVCIDRNISLFIHRWYGSLSTYIRYHIYFMRIIYTLRGQSALFPVLSASLTLPHIHLP